MKIDENWNEHSLTITDEYGFKQFSISDFIKEMKDKMTKKGCKRVLDLGCGSGRHSIYFDKAGFEVYAIDIDCGMIRKNLKRLNIDDINVLESSFTDIPCKSDFFDAVICMSTLHHAVISDIKKGIFEVLRVLKPGGYFVFDFLSKKDISYGLGTEIEKDTFEGSRAGEDNIPHHYTDENELKMLLKDFSDTQIRKSIYSFADLKGNKYTSKCFDICAIK